MDGLILMLWNILGREEKIDYYKELNKFNKENYTKEIFSDISPNIIRNSMIS